MTLTTISVVVHPNSKKPRIEKDSHNVLHVYVSAPPIEGRANEAVIEALADYLHIKRNAIYLVSGEKSKYKRFQVMN